MVTKSSNESDVSKTDLSKKQILQNSFSKHDPLFGLFALDSSALQFSVGERYFPSVLSFVCNIALIKPNSFEEIDINVFESPFFRRAVDDAVNVVDTRDLVSIRFNSNWANWFIKLIVHRFNEQPLSEFVSIPKRFMNGTHFQSMAKISHQLTITFSHLSRIS